MFNIFLDTETTGLNTSTVLGVGDQVVQLGGLITDEDFKPIKGFAHFCDNLKPEVSPGAQEVNGLSMKVIRNYIPNKFLSEIIVSELPEFFEDDVRFFGYNLPFDIKMIDNTIMDSGVNIDWGTNTTSTLIHSGHSNIDIMQYTKTSHKYRKLESIVNTESPIFIDFYDSISNLHFESNIPDLMQEVTMHCSFIDSVCTYLVWINNVWKIKVF